MSTIKEIAVIDTVLSAIELVDETITVAALREQLLQLKTELEAKVTDVDRFLDLFNPL